VGPLRRTRQVRDFTPEPPTADQLDAILDVARWSGSSQNSQPWRFIVIRDPDTIRTIGNAGLTLTRSLLTATAAVAIVLPVNPERAVSLAYDEGRVSERILVAAGVLGLGAGIAWIKTDARPVVTELLALPPDRMVRTIMAIGRPTDAARAPKSAPGTARLPREAVVFQERWPAG
jgi:nitroreductase